MENYMFTISINQIRSQSFLKPLALVICCIHLKKQPRGVVNLFIALEPGGEGGAEGGRPPPTLFGPGGQGEPHHFEPQPLVCIVCSEK